MSTEIADLFARIGADTSGLKAGLNEAKTGLQGASMKFTELNSIVSLAGQGLNMVGQVFAETIGEAQKYSLAMGDLGHNLGISTEQASRLVQVADDYRITQEKLTTATELAIRKGWQPSISNMAALSDEYLAIQDPVKQTAFLFEKFGKNWSVLVPLLQAGGDAIRANAAATEQGLVVTDKQYDASLRLYAAQDKLNDATQALGLTLGNALIPPLTTTLDLTNEAASAIGVYGSATDAHLKGLITMGEYVGVVNKALLIGHDATAAQKMLDDELMQHALPAAQGYQRAMGPMPKIIEANTGAEIEHERALIASRNALNSYGKAADGVAIALGNISNAEAAEIAMDNLTAAYDKGELSEKAYAIQAETIMRGIGGMSEAEIQANLKIRDLGKALDDGTITASQYASMVGSINAQINALHSKDVTLTVNHIDNYTTHRDPNKPGQGYQHGADFVVPPGFSGDTYSMRVSSGERVQVTPVGEKPKGGAGITQNFYMTDPLIAKMVLAQVRRDNLASIESRL